MSAYLPEHRPREGNEGERRLRKVDRATKKRPPPCIALGLVEEFAGVTSGSGTAAEGANRK